MKLHAHVGTSAHMIVDRDGHPQLQTLRSSPAKSWEALFGRKLSSRERRVWKKRGFVSVMVWVESFRTQ